jgi:hypothetical protein
MVMKVKVNFNPYSALIILLVLIVSASRDLMAQNEIAIGSGTTKSNAILWLNGNGSQGLLLPVVTNKSAVANPDEGMILYDNADNKVWYRNDNTWIEVGGGTPSNLKLQLQGNKLKLLNGTTEISSVDIAGGTQTSDSFLVFNGTSWQFSTLSGDVTGANGALQVNGIKGKAMATLPASLQALVYDPSANSGGGGWVFQSLTGGGTVPALVNGQILIGNGTTNSAATLSGDASISGGVLTIANNAITTAKINAGAVDNTKLAANSVTASNIQDGTITGTDVAAGAISGTNLANATITGANIAATTITADKLAQSLASNGQVLKWNGTNWVPASDDTGSGSLPTLTSGQLVTNDGSTNVAVTMNGDATFNATGAISIANNAITTAKINANAVDATKLADNAVTSLKIADGSVAAADLANGSVSGGTGGVITDASITNADVSATAAIAVTKLATGANGQLLTIVGGVPTWQLPAASTDAQDLSLSGTTLSLTNDATPVVLGNLSILNAVTTTEITDATITGADIGNGAITGSNIAATTITADKLAQSSATNGQVLKWNGTNWVPQNDDAGAGGAPTLNNGQIIIGDGSSNSAATLTGDATLSGGLITISNNAITTAKINANAVDGTKLADNAVTSIKIADASIAAADLANGSVSGGVGGVITDGSITDADISATAAIAGTKVTPAFGAQNISTTGTLSAGATTVTGLTINGAAWPANAGGVLTNNGSGTLTWGATLANPMTTAGDIIYGGAAGVATRLATGIGFLKGGAIPSYSAINLASSDVAGTLPIANGGTGAITAAGALINLGALGTASTAGGDLSGTFSNLQLVSGAVVDADVSATAAIAGTKVVPSFGTQNILTTGTLTTGTSTTFGSATLTWPATNASGVLTNDGTGALSWGSSSSGWGLTGNTGTNPTTNFIGTIDAQDLVFKTNNSLRFKIGSTGNGNLTIGNNPLPPDVLASEADLEVYRSGESSTIRILGDDDQNQVLQFYGRPKINPQANGADVDGWALLRFNGGEFVIAKNTGYYYNGNPNATTNNALTIDPSTRDVSIVTGLQVGGQIRISGGSPASGYVLTSDATGLASWAAPGAGSGWGLTGNSGTNPATNFLGTTDVQPLLFKTGVGGVERMRIDASGNVGIGTISPLNKLHVQATLTGTPITTTPVARFANSTLNGNTKIILGSDNTTADAFSNFTAGASAGTQVLGFGVGNAASTTTQLNLTGSGNVGIGTTQPAYLLTLGSGNFGMDNSYQLLAKNSGGTYESYLWPRYSDDVMYLNYGSGGFNIRNNTSTTTMFMTNGGYVGINTTSPAAPLHVATNSGVSGCCWDYTYFNDASGGLVSINGGSFTNVAIRAEGNIWANGFPFVSSSDRRIKNVIGKTNNQKDLNDLMNIEITDYEFIDKVLHGNRVHKKVIAQQVEAVYPNAIDKTSNVIPSVFEVAKQVKVEGGKTIIETSKPHQFATGDEVKLILEKIGEKQFTVSVLNDNTFVVDEVLSSNVFVYGKTVNDFLTVDYDALTTLNISATQHLSKEVDSLKSKLNDCEKKITALEATLEALKSDRTDHQVELQKGQDAMQRDIDLLKRLLVVQANNK